MTTLQEKNNLLLQLQCLHGQYGNYLYRAMSIGKCTEKELCVNTRAFYGIEVVRRYKVFDETVTNAGKVIITRLIEGTDVTVEVFADSILLGSYTGTGSVTEILNHLQTIINGGTSLHNYYAIVNENILYLYSYSNLETYNSLLVGTYTENEILEDEHDHSLSISSESLEHKLDEILDIWNCVTGDELCCIKQYMKSNLIK